MVFRIICVFFAALFMFSNSSWADSDSQNPKSDSQAFISGVYMGTNVGVGYPVKHITDQLDKDLEIINVFMGYQVNRFMALEVGYVHFPDVIIEKPEHIPTAVRYTDSLSGVYTALKTMLPFGDNFNVYAKLGQSKVSNRMTTEFDNQPDQTQWNEYHAPYAAGGLSFAPSKNVAFTLEFSSFVKQTTYELFDEFVSLGLNFRFSS